MESHNNLIRTTTSTTIDSPIMIPSATTFVQAEAETFKEVVQKLTGSSGESSEKLPVSHTARQPIGPRRSGFKLQDRRHTMKKLEIKLTLASISDNHDDHNWSPVTPLSSREFDYPSPSPSPETSAHHYRKSLFFLKPDNPPLRSPLTNSHTPELLNLFPLTSPSKP